MRRYGSVCSGIEAATMAWDPIGWSPAWFAEIEPFPCAVLAHHWPEVSNLGDFTLIRDRISTGEVEAPDVLVGGTPCQAFSVAGLRQSLDDKRGQLTLEFVRLADAIDSARSIRGQHPVTVVWENVPGVLNTPDNAFGCFLAGLVGEDDPLEPPGGRWTNAGYVRGPRRAVAWRILDAQYFGVAQRRRRVFLVASAGDLRPEQVLFELEGVRRDSPPSREAGKGFAAVAGTLTSNGGGLNRPAGNANELDFCVPVVMSTGQGGVEIAEDSAPTPTCNHEAPIGFIPPAVGFNARQDPDSWEEHAGPLDTFGNSQAVQYGAQVRRLTPTECERLQGFPDGHTMVPTTMVRHRRTCDLHGTKEVVPAGTIRLPCGCKAKHVAATDCPDGPRYKALGNSMAVPVMRWIGERIEKTAMTA